MAKRSSTASDESGLRKKILETHDHDDGGGVLFDTESLLASIEAMLELATPRSVDDHPDDEKMRTSMPHPVLPDTMPDTLPSLLNSITCVLNCKCLGGDGHASAMEILQLLANYSWEAKIVIILASYVVEYGQYTLVASLLANNPLARFVAALKLRVDQTLINSKFEAIIRLVTLSIEVTRFIPKFGCFPPKHISKDAQPMILALDLIPIAVYWITRSVVACASEHSAVLGQTHITSSYAETWNITTLEEKITTIQTTFKDQHDVCIKHIEERKQIKYVEKLKVMFGQTTLYANNQKILQAIFNKKDGSPPLSCGHVEAKTKMVGVEVLKGKTVLLLISDLQISHEEIDQISLFYQETRTKTELKYEIVWLPIVEKMEEIEEFEKKYTELSGKMGWYVLEHPKLVKQGFVKYVKEEWRYSKKSIMVALDQKGKVAHLNAFHMMLTWGNAVYPFTDMSEKQLWKSKEWSLHLLVQEMDIKLSTWIKEDKYICLFGGEDSEWLEEYVTKASDAAKKAGIKLEMVYICKKGTKQDSKKFTGILSGRCDVWDNTKSTFFWKRIESMMYSKIHHGAKVGTTKESGGDMLLSEVVRMLTLGDSDNGWGLISHGAGSGPAKIAKAKGDVMLKAFVDFEEWSVEAKNNFAMALHGHLAYRRSKMEHHCNRFILPGTENVPELFACSECHRPMERYIMYRCCTD